MYFNIVFNYYDDYNDYDGKSNIKIFVLKFYYSISMFEFCYIFSVNNNVTCFYST